MAIPLYQDIKYQNPLDIFSLFAQQDGAVFLDSAQLMQGCGRYSFIAIDPFYLLSSKNGIIYLNKKKYTGDPLQVLANQLGLYPLETLPNLPPFQGGVAGFFSYDLYQHLENIRSSQLDDMQFPDLALGFYDLVIAFDHDLKRAGIFSSGYPETKSKERENRAKERCEWLIQNYHLDQGISNQAMNLNQKIKIEKLASMKIESKKIEFKKMESKKTKIADIRSNFSSENYQKAVQKVKDYILAGDIFEANISQRFCVEMPKDFSALELYHLLRNLNPAPFSAYINFDDTVIASASPERFLKLTHGQIETRPIKGTRPRGKTEKDDLFYANELVNSEKDQAENVMIVDLLRNDLSRVCDDHSVKVPQLCGLESYSTVHHLVSVVTGKLQTHLNAIDLLCASFPGGSITGAPKIRAMEIIAEIEPTRRGPYCGSIGYIGFNGDMDTSVAIRTYAIKKNFVTFQAGGAVVLDSDPLSEYQETLIKAEALIKALVQ